MYYKIQVPLRVHPSTYGTLASCMTSIYEENPQKQLAKHLIASTPYYKDFENFSVSVWQNLPFLRVFHL